MTPGPVTSGATSPVRTTWRRSGASAAAAVTVAANSWLPSSTRARESTTSLPSSRPVSIVEDGTATAPTYIAARIPVASSTSSTMQSSTRSSGRTPIPTSPAATRRTSTASSS